MGTGLQKERRICCSDVQRTKRNWGKKSEQGRDKKKMTSPLGAEVPACLPCGVMARLYPPGPVAAEMKALPRQSLARQSRNVV